MKLLRSLTPDDLTTIADCLTGQSASSRSLLARGAGPVLTEAVVSQSRNLDRLASAFRLAVAGQLLLDVAGVAQPEAEAIP